MKPKRILIVDDDRDFAESMADLIELNGHEAILAYNGTSALKIFKQNNIDLILMDIRMPGLNGVETLNEIKKYNPSIPVAMMTGYTDKSLIDSALEIGAITILDKPLNLHQLAEIINSIKNKNTILLLDDDKDFTDSLYELLCSKGYEVLTANTINKALQFAEENVIDICLLDLRINGKSGIDLCNMLSSKGIDIPVIFLTGYADDFNDQIKEISRNKKVTVMRKPFKLAEFIKIVDTIAC